MNRGKLKGEEDIELEGMIELDPKWRQGQITST